MTRTEAIEIAAEHLCIAISMSRNVETAFNGNDGVLLGLFLSPEESVIKITELADCYKDKK